MTDRFLAFSSEITAFTVFELQGTGQTEAYRAAVAEVVTQQFFDQLLNAYDAIGQDGPQTRDERLRKEIFGHEKLGPIARNIIKLWYSGIWYELPHAWTETFGAREKNVTFMVSAGSYQEALVWSAIGASPPGAKAPGYGTWANPPIIPSVPAVFDATQTD